MARRRKRGRARPKGFKLFRFPDQAARKRGEVKGLLALLLIGLLLVVAFALFEQQGARGRWFPSGRPAPEAPRNPQGEVRIATWNLRKFSDRSAPDLVAIAKIIRENEFDLLAIQEVQREGQVVERLRRQLNEPWRHIVSPRTGNNERYAFLYRSDRVEPVSTPILMSGPEFDVFDRAPYVGMFRAGAFDFTLATVHLSYADLARRRGEAEALARFASTLAANGQERDVIVLGDFNEQERGTVRAGGEESGRANLHYFDAMGWRRLNEEPTNLGSVQYVYDNILIDPKFTREFAGRVGVVRFDTTYRGDTRRAIDDISDHRPVYADFAATADDD